MEYLGATSFNLNGTTNALTISSSIGSITYDRPTVYQINSGNIVIPITSWTADWVQNGATNKYKFNLGTYDNTKALIIEVDRGNSSVTTSINNINWSTYFGGSLYDQINKIKSDASNNLFAAGQTWSALFPQNSGAVVLQPGLGGSSDAFVAKFKPTGELEWTTYKGGSREDMIMSFDISSSGDIYAVGNTRSGDLVCVPKSGAYNNSTFVGPLETAHSYGWCTDGFIFQLNQAGNSSAWTTYILTGNLFDWFNNCKFDATGRFFVVGTTSSTDAPVVASGSQYSHAFSNPATPFNIYDGYIACFNPAGTRIWATCLGASTTTSSPPDDELYGLDFSQWGDLYVVGRSSGNNFPNVVTGSGATASTNYAQNGTAQNGTITKFGYNNDLQYSSYMGGTTMSALTSVWCNQTNDNVLVTGYTLASGYPFVNSGNYYLQSFQGVDDAVFSVFNGINQLTHSTYYGGTGLDEGWDIQMDQDNMIYLAGKSKSVSLPAPAGGNPVNTYTSGHVSVMDYFICTFREFRTGVIWSTYLGGSGDESDGNGRRVSIAMDGNNYLHLAGQTNSSASFPTDNNGGPPTYFQPAISNITDGTITRFDMGPIQLVGVDEIDAQENGIFVYPNPTSSALSLQVDKLTENLSYTIYNSLGQILMTGKITSLVTSLDMQNLNSGMYLIEIRDDEGRGTTRFIKNN
ncbi:MAG: T9SS type A sorting domain-containing protein [Bacteroidetes bacterium]|nr:T9SS type A sorting domain-containing protein [Bacteroidota bacterium]